MVSPRQRQASILISCLCFVLFYEIYDRWQPQDSPEISGLTGETLRGYGQEKEKESDTGPYNNCSITPSTAVATTSSFHYWKKRPRPKKSKPIWVASFPGSGAELFRSLITSITNQPTVDAAITKNCVRSHAVACKTHWPVMKESIGFPDPEASHGYFQRDPPYATRAIVLLRNPANAIPSWYNQIWEARVKATFHSKQAPYMNWIRWSRHRGRIRERFTQWIDLIIYWLESPYYTVDVFVPYEQMIDAASGPQLLGKVAMSLLESQVATVIPPNRTADLECLWNSTVQQKATMKRSEHKYQPSYTSEHQQLMLILLDEFLLEVSYREDLVSILQGYRREIEHNLVIED